MYRFLYGFMLELEVVGVGILNYNVGWKRRSRCGRDGIVSSEGIVQLPTYEIESLLV